MNEKINTGGPAFPTFMKNGDLAIAEGGMTLRDYFMAHAPAEPQLWFVPVMPPAPDDLTSRLAAIIQEMSAHQVVEVKAARYVRVALAAQSAGYSDKAIRRKIEDSAWREVPSGCYRRVAKFLFTWKGMRNGARGDETHAGTVDGRK